MAVPHLLNHQQLRKENYGQSSDAALTSFPMSSLLSLRQRQAGYTHPLTLAPNVIKTLRGKKKIKKK